MALAFTLTDKPEPADIKCLSDGLTAHMTGAGHPTEWREFAVFARDENGHIRGGAAGNSGQCAIFIRLLWVHEAERRRGLGRQLLTMAEDEGRRRGCHTAFLDTFSFQAPLYYPQFGYAEFGRIEGLGPQRNVTRTWFVKRLD